ncbi:MAG TPA: 3'-5' exonuclease [Kofleriaceae bacterium]|nr:3'-5' exonuclease [Kofleriaceae bacterium]
MFEANYYLVVDLEATCDDAGAVPRDESEIIEIGAVLVDGKTLTAVDEFQTFVRPIVHPTLTVFCRELTTITQADVDHAPTFPEVAPELAKLGADALFCSWGNYDRNQLAADARRHRIAMPLPGAHLNIKEQFAKALGGKKQGTYQALSRVGLRPTGTHHRGIDDARNIARLLPWALGRASCRGLRP